MGDPLHPFGYNFRQVQPEESVPILDSSQHSNLNRFFLNPSAQSQPMPQYIGAWQIPHELGGDSIVDYSTPFGLQIANTDERPHSIVQILRGHEDGLFPGADGFSNDFQTQPDIDPQVLTNTSPALFGGLRTSSFQSQSPSTTIGSNTPDTRYSTTGDHPLSVFQPNMGTNAGLEHSPSDLGNSHDLWSLSPNEAQGSITGLIRKRKAQSTLDQSKGSHKKTASVDLRELPANGSPPVPSNNSSDRGREMVIGVTGGDTDHASRRQRKGRLTSQERKANHTKSEKARRDRTTGFMNQLFDICGLVDSKDTKAEKLNGIINWGLRIEAEIKFMTKELSAGRYTIEQHAAPDLSSSALINAMNPGTADAYETSAVEDYGINLGGFQGDNANQSMDHDVDRAQALYNSPLGITDPVADAFSQTRDLYGDLQLH